MSVYLETRREGFPPKRACGSGAALLMLEVVLLFPSMDSGLEIFAVLQMHVLWIVDAPLGRGDREGRWGAVNQSVIPLRMPLPLRRL